MTPEQLSALAQQAGATHFTPPPLRAVRGWSFTHEQMAVFADAVAAQHARAGKEAPSYDKKALNGLLHDFARACAFRTDETARMKAANAIHNWASAAVAAAPQTVAASRPIAHRVVDVGGKPLTDWIDGAPDEGMAPAFIGGRFQCAYAPPANKGGAAP